MQTINAATPEADFLQAMQQEEDEQKAKDQAVLAQVRASTSPEVFADIEACIAESGYVYDFKLAAKPKGYEQVEDYTFGPYFVDQTMNGGCTGDSFAGTISIPLAEGQWFEFTYSM